MKYEPLTSDSFFHIYNCGNNKEDIFKEDRNYSYFLKLLEKHVLPVAEIWSYCLLKNHFHILVKTKEKIDDKKISQGFSNLFNAYSKAINKAYNRCGSLFKDRFSRIKVDKEIYLKSLILYINSNAVHHGFTTSIEKYKYSSYLELISLRKTFLEREKVISYFDCVENFKLVMKRKQDLMTGLTLE